MLKNLHLKKINSTFVTVNYLYLFFHKPTSSIMKNAIFNPSTVSTVLNPRNGANVFTPEEIQEVEVFKSSTVNALNFAQLTANLEENNRLAYHGTKVSMVDGLIVGEPTKDFEKLMEISKKAFPKFATSMPPVVVIKNFITGDFNTVTGLIEDGVKIFTQKDKTSDGFHAFFFELAAGFTRLLTTFNAAIKFDLDLSQSNANIPYNVLTIPSNFDELQARNKARHENLLENLGTARVSKGNSVAEILKSFQMGVFDGLKESQIAPNESLNLNSDLEVNQLVKVAFNGTPTLLRVVGNGLLKKTSLNKILLNKQLVGDGLSTIEVDEETGNQYIANDLLDKFITAIPVSTVAGNEVFKNTDIDQTRKEFQKNGDLVKTNQGRPSKETETPETETPETETVKKMQNDATQTIWLRQLTDADGDLTALNSLAKDVEKAGNADKETVTAIENAIDKATKKVDSDKKRTENANFTNTGKLVHEFVNTYIGLTDDQLKEKLPETITEENFVLFQQVLEVMESFKDCEPISDIVALFDRTETIG